MVYSRMEKGKKMTCVKWVEVVIFNMFRLGWGVLGGGGSIQSAQNGSKRGHVLLEMVIKGVGTRTAVREDMFYLKWG